MNFVFCMNGKATIIKVRQLRCDFFSQKYQGTLGQVLIVNDGIFSSCIVLVFLLLVEYPLKCMFKNPTIRHSYQFTNVPSHEWHNCIVDDGPSIFN